MPLATTFLAPTNDLGTTLLSLDEKGVKGEFVLQMYGKKDEFFARNG